MLRNVGSLTDFDAFLRLVAARTGSTLDLADIARTLGVAAIAGPLGGALFETAVVTEVHRALLHRGLPAELYRWGVPGRSEVDLLVRHEGRFVPLEIKLSATPTPRFGDQLRSLARILPEETRLPGYVVTPGASTLPLGPRP